MKTIAIQQPYLFPYIGYYQLLSLCDKFIILDDVNFIKKGWINRNQILGNQEPLLFTVPIKDASQNRHIKNTLLHETYPMWLQKFNITLSRTYQKRAPFYGIGRYLIDKVFNSCKPEDSISKLATESLKIIAKYLKLKTEIVESSTIYNNQTLKGQDRILDICKQEKADQYVNLIGGAKLYSQKDFATAGIDLKFHRILKYNYKQSMENIEITNKHYDLANEKEFQPFLSMIDVLMFCNSDQILELLKEYELTNSD